jgi:site-specific recombinase XerD
MLTSEQIGLFKGDRVPRPRPDLVGDDDMQDGDEPNRACDGLMVTALLQTIGTPFDELPARNRAIVLMLFESGMRVGELCRLSDRNVDLDNRTTKVRGKGGKTRYVFWGPQTAAALRRYLALRRTAPTSAGSPLFRGCSSRNNGGRITRDSVRAMIKRTAESAGMELPAYAPVHGFRSGFAQWALDEGVDGLDLQQLLGHADIRTTQIYVKRHPKKLREVHRRLFAVATRPLKRQIS